MSEKQKWPRAEALVVANELLMALAPACSRIEIAGSLRRGKEIVGDVEILYVGEADSLPDPNDLFGGRIPIDRAEWSIGEFEASRLIARRKNVNGSETWGDKNKLAVHVASGIPVDLFATTEENWWTSLVVRTGGLESNLALTKGARERGRTLLAYGAGVKNLETGEITRADSERAVFELCGVPFREPQDRP